MKCPPLNFNRSNVSLRELVGSSLPKKSRTQTIEMITEFLHMKIMFCFVGGGRCIIHYKYFNRKQYADVSWSVLKERLNEFEPLNIQKSKSTCTTSAGKKMLQTRCDYSPTNFAFSWCHWQSKIGQTCPSSLFEGNWYRDRRKSLEKLAKVVNSLIDK